MLGVRREFAKGNRELTGGSSEGCREFAERSIDDRITKIKKKEKQKKTKDKSGDSEKKTTDPAKLRAKLEKLDAKIDALKAKKEEVIKQLFELEGTANN
ncbi:hypothetical protein BHM03_00039150 [Ensete ventricosum]|nr:hypothetical protein BHM03_00039150 [Ensete ventricosum]